MCGVCWKERERIFAIAKCMCACMEWTPPVKAAQRCVVARDEENTREKEDSSVYIHVCVYWRWWRFLLCLPRSLLCCCGVAIDLMGCFVFYVLVESIYTYTPVYGWSRCDTMEIIENYKKYDE